MITRQQLDAARERAAEFCRHAGILARPEEYAHIEVVHLGLNDLERVGLQVMTLVNTPNLAAKVLVLFPDQTFAEHRHPRLGDYPGKEETVRAIWGEMRLYTEGEPTISLRGHLPPHGAEHIVARREIVLLPGEQYTIPPNTWHWFQAGGEGAVAWSFSSTATDAQDEFTDPEARRFSPVAD